MFDTIVVATDASPASRAATSLALQLAKLDGSALHFVNVVDVARLMPLSGYDSPYPEEAVAEVEDEAEALLDAAKQQAQASGIAATTHCGHGNAADEIVAAAKACDAKLIVMGTHGRTGLARFFIGSVADTVLRSAPCAVLVTRDGGSDA